MGGFGSTRWAAISTRDTVDGYLALDINQLNKAGCFQLGFCGVWEWSCEGKLVAPIWLSYEADHLTLRYAHGAADGSWADVKQRIPLVWTSCRLGGRRPYFLCPGTDCGRHALKLYGAAPDFLCRDCRALAYPCQREHRIDRALRRLRKLRSRIGSASDDGSIPGRRPKGMRESTFRKLVTAIVEAEMAVDDALDDYATRLERRRH